MNLGATLTGVLPELRAQAESRMLDTFEIRVSSGGYVWDPAADGGNGADVEAFTVLFSTRGRVKVGGGLAAADAQVGERTTITVTRELHIPVNSPAIPANAEAVCTAVDAMTDPTLLGARLRLAGPAPGSQTTARRLQVTEVLT